MSALPLVTVFGGTGFIGRAIVQELVKAGYAVQVFARHPKRAARLQPLGYQNRVIYRRGDLTQPRSFQDSLAGSVAVINAVGILYETRRQRFSALHAQGPERLAKLAREAGVPHFIHLSAIGADKAVQSVYARTKGAGEKAVLAAFPEAIILRPSVVFGAEDNFFNQFARMATLSPALPLIGGGRTRFQPVYVSDVAQAAVRALHHPDLRSQVLELGGPDRFTFREILEFILTTTRRKRCLVTLPWSVAGALAFCLELSPFTPLLTRDQVRLLKHDNLVQPERDGFALLGMRPRSVTSIVPSYLARYRPGGSDLPAEPVLQAA